MTVQRHIPLDGQPDFRDLGGYRTTDGRTVVDFRSVAEVKSRGEDRLPEGVSYLPLVFHCTHGKDRAGVASAWVHQIGATSESC